MWADCFVLQHQHYHGGQESVFCRRSCRQASGTLNIGASGVRVAQHCQGLNCFVIIFLSAILLTKWIETSANRNIALSLEWFSWLFWRIKFVCIGHCCGGRGACCPRGIPCCHTKGWPCWNSNKSSSNCYNYLLYLNPDKILVFTIMMHDDPTNTKL